MWTNLMVFFIMLIILKCPPLLAQILCFETNSNSCSKLTLKLRICVRLAAIFYVEHVAVLTMTLSYVRLAVIVYHYGRLARALFESWKWN